MTNTEQLPMPATGAESPGPEVLDDTMAGGSSGGNGGGWGKWGERLDSFFLIVAVLIFVDVSYNATQFAAYRWGPAELDDLQTYESLVDKRCPRHTLHGVASETHDFDIPDWDAHDAIECFSNEAGLAGELWDGNLHFKPHPLKGRMTSMEALAKMLGGTPAATYGAFPSGRSISIVARADIPMLQEEDAAEAAEAAKTGTH